MEAVDKQDAELKAARNKVFGVTFTGVGQGGKWCGFTPHGLAALHVQAEGNRAVVMSSAEAAVEAFLQQQSEEGGGGRGVKKELNFDGDVSHGHGLEDAAAKKYKDITPKQLSSWMEDLKADAET